MTGTGTSADIAERAARRYETARKITEGGFLLAALAIGFGVGIGTVETYVEGDIGLPLAVLLLAGLGAFAVLYARLVRAGMQGRTPVRELVLSALLAAGLSAMAVKQPFWVSFGPFWASAAALCVPGVRRIIALCVGTGAVAATYTVVAEEDAHWFTWPAMFVFLSVISGLVVSANMMQKWVWDVLREAYSAREAQARLAVSEERLRFARDLHDLLGHNLSLIAVKSELAIRMADADPARAKVEMADVRQAARDALREVRAAVHGYRVVELDAELAGVRAVLNAAGVRCTVTGTPGELPSEIGGVLAWVVREGATNVLKHSDARRCEIVLTRHDDSVVLEMTNDGARPAAGTDQGTGLTGLAERLAVVGGGLAAEHAGQGRYLLRAAVPLPAVQNGDPLRSVA